MIFDLTRPDHAYTDPCVLLGLGLPKAAGECSRHWAEAVKRKSVEFRILVYPFAYSKLCRLILALCLPQFLFAGTLGAHGLGNGDSIDVPEVDGRSAFPG